MRDVNILRYVLQAPWAILDEKWAEIVPVLLRHARGERLTAGEIQARIGDPAPATASKRGAVAVVPIRGVIAHRMGSLDDTSGGTSAERIAALFRTVLADESVGTVVLDVDSPGGTIPGVPELAAEIFAARGRKKLVAVANSVMASAAYFLASQADEIVAIPSALAIGSIGVFTAHEDLSGLLEREGVKITLISAGRFKTEGNPFEPLSDEARAVLQAKVDAAYGEFVKAVARGRGVSSAAVRNGFGEGRALNAKDALAAGLIDRIATMEETIARLVGRKVPSGVRADATEAPLATASGEVATPAAALADMTEGEAEANRARRVRVL